MHDKKHSKTAELIFKTLSFGSIVEAENTTVTERNIGLYRKIAAQLYSFPRAAEAILRNPLFKELVKISEAVMLPGFVAHVVSRERCIHDHAAKFLREGGQSLFIVGGGFDLLGFDMASAFPAAKIVECDHPNTQGLKVEALVGGQPPNLCLVGVDLSKTPLEDVLAKQFSHGEKCLVIVEGVLMYLPETAVTEFFRKVKAYFVVPTVLFSFINMEVGGRLAFEGSNPLIRLWLRLVSEPFLWGIPRSQIGSFLKPLGFAKLEIYDQDFFRKYYFGNSPKILALGEILGFARN